LPAPIRSHKRVEISPALAQAATPSSHNSQRSNVIGLTLGYRCVIPVTALPEGLRFPGLTFVYDNGLVKPSIDQQEK